MVDWSVVDSNSIRGIKIPRSAETTSNCEEVFGASVPTPNCATIIFVKTRSTITVYNILFIGMLINVNFTHRIMIRSGSTIRFDIFLTKLQQLYLLDTIIIRKQAEFLGFILSVFRKKTV